MSCFDRLSKSLLIATHPCYQHCCDHMFSLSISILFLSPGAEGMFAFRMSVDVKLSLFLIQPHSSGTKAVMPGPGPPLLSRTQQAPRPYICLRRADSPPLLCLFFTQMNRMRHGQKTQPIITTQCLTLPNPMTICQHIMFLPASQLHSRTDTTLLGWTCCSCYLDVQPG